MFKRLHSLHRFLAMAGLLFALGGLPACSGIDPGLVQGSLKLHFRQSPEERKAAQEQIAKAESWSSIAFWNTALGEAMYYLPDSFRSDLTKNEDTFINFVVGAYLARYPDVTYDSIDSIMNEAGVLDAAGITRERFDYARRFGQVWLKSIEDDPKNKAMKERLALFQKRFGSRDTTYYTSIFQPHKIRTLLRDDQAFKAFLTDDAAAIAWVDRNQDINKTVRDNTFQYVSIQELLSPITVGVLPGLAS